MTSLSIDQPATIIRRDPSIGRRVGIGLSGFSIAFLALDAAGKLFMPETMIANTPPIGLPADVGFYRLLGGILAVCTTLYAWPRTSFLGAGLLTGYLGGALAVHLIAGSPLFSATLFSVYIGAFVWGGLWLRDAEIRGILPLRAN